jgi:hypothetical protein
MCEIGSSEFFYKQCFVFVIHLFTIGVCLRTVVKTNLTSFSVLKMCESGG